MATQMTTKRGPNWAFWRAAMWGTAAVLLLLPALAMQFDVEGLHWSGSDFVVMGVLLATCCAIVELGAWVSSNAWYRAAFAAAVLAGFLLVWVSLAVGIINDLSDRANLMFAGVLATGAIGALLSRFKAQGMARTMVATAVVQLLIGVIALVWHMGIEAIAFGGFLSVIWLASSWMFRQAARGQSLARSYTEG